MDQIAQDHRSLGTLLAEIDDVMEAQVSTPLTPVVDLLTTLTKSLAAHFTHEEHSDLYVGVPKRLPEVAERLAELKVEHGTMLELMIDAQGAVQRLEEARAEANRLVSRLGGTLREHERSEAEIMQRAFLTDV